MPDAVSGCECSRRHPEFQAECHITAQAERDDVAPEQVSESDHMNSTGPAGFIDPGVRKMKEATTIGADERAQASDGFFALHAAGGGHRPIVDWAASVGGGELQHVAADEEQDSR